jgi:hypothetical protein
VLPGADPGEPDLTGSGAPIVGAVTSAEPVDPVAWARQIAMDPGSTGGLFDAIAQGGLGPVPTGSVFQRTLETYRRAVAAHRVRR